MALDRTLWRTRLGRGYGLVVRQTTEWMNEWMNEWGHWWPLIWTCSHKDSALVWKLYPVNIISSPHDCLSCASSWKLYRLISCIFWWHEIAFGLFPLHADVLRLHQGRWCLVVLDSVIAHMCLCYAVIQWVYMKQWTVCWHYGYFVCITIVWHSSVF